MLLPALLMMGAVTTIVAVWLSHAAGPGATAPERINVISTALTAAAGTGGAFGLLLAFRRQRSTEISDAHSIIDAVERRVTELYTKAAEQLGSDKAPVRLAGLYALERLAEQNAEHRQTIVNVLCAYLRMPAPDGSTVIGLTSPQPGSGSAAQDRAAKEEMQVRLAAQRILGEHLQVDRSGPDYFIIENDKFWEGIALDLSGATLVNFSLQGCQIEAADFTGAEFTGHANFDGAKFRQSLGSASFSKAKFRDGVWFSTVRFGGHAFFTGAEFTGDAVFHFSEFDKGGSFAEAMFDGKADFSWTKFREVEFSGGASFPKVKFRGEADFKMAQFGGPPEGVQYGVAVRYDKDGNIETVPDDEIGIGVAARFDEAEFTGNARFCGTTFIASGLFRGARFCGDAQFAKTEEYGQEVAAAKICGYAEFSEAEFNEAAEFRGVQFSRGAWFRAAKFGGNVDFMQASADEVKLDGCGSVGGTG